jgi:hypothetical protein
LQKGPKIGEAIWVLTTQGDLRPSNQVFAGGEYQPSENWERHARYSPQMSFVSPAYIENVPPAGIPAWKSFFTGVGVHESGEKNHVEIFAMEFVEVKLGNELRDFIATNRQQVGYDREARSRQDGGSVKLEIKGQKKEQPVQLVGNEPGAAAGALGNGERFWVCVVPGIPEEPQLWVVEEPLRVGHKETVTIDVSDWRSSGRRLA